MKCRKCKRIIEYDFQLPNKIWKEAWKKSGAIGINSKRDGVLCAHCTLNSLGLKIWIISQTHKKVK